MKRFDLGSVYPVDEDQHFLSHIQIYWISNRLVFYTYDIIKLDTGDAINGMPNLIISNGGKFDKSVFDGIFKTNIKISRQPDPACSDRNIFFWDTELPKEVMNYLKIIDGQ